MNKRHKYKYKFLLVNRCVQSSVSKIGLSNPKMWAYSESGELKEIKLGKLSVIGVDIASTPDCTAYHRYELTPTVVMNDKWKNQLCVGVK